MLQDMLQLLKESVSSKHSERLEQIVIALIGIEIGKRHCLALLKSLRLMEQFFFSFGGDHNLGRSLLVDSCTLIAVTTQGFPYHHSYTQSLLLLNACYSMISEIEPSLQSAVSIVP